MIRRRLFQFALSSSLTQAWAQKSKKWLSIAGIIMILRIIDSRAVAAERRRSKKKSA